MGTLISGQPVLALFSALAAIEAANVLIMPSSLFPVHRFTMRILADELIKRGHNVTWIEYAFHKSKITLPKGTDEIFWRVTSSKQEIRDLYRYQNHSAYSRIWYADFNDDAQQTTAWMTSIEMCNQILSEHKAEFDALVAKKFTTVILDDLYNPCGLLLVALQKSTYIYWSLSALRTESAWANQSPSPPSYLPVPGTRLTDDLTFLQRFYNVASYFRALYIHQHLILRRIDKLYKKYYAGMVPDAFYIERNASVNFVNTPQIFDFARPYMPRVTFIGAIQCRKPSPLEGDLLSFVDRTNARNGFVLFTTGFTAHWKYAPKRLIESFVQAFREMPEIHFIWQYNGPAISNLLANVYIAEWLPQQDILGHPKARAHISHGGLNSVIESAWHGVPVIGIPLTTFGYDNLLRLTARNVGILLSKEDLNTENIKKAVKEIYNPKYKKEMLILQDMVTDVPYTELNHSAFWVEFIERHNEVPHARSGADELNFLQYFLVDIVVFVLSIALFVSFIIYLTLKSAIKIICRAYRSGSVSVQKKQQ